ncbi:MAG: DUF6985 domain-containing protein [Mangrovibacterium sp.]
MNRENNLEFLKEAYNENSDINSYWSRPCRAFFAPYMDNSSQTEIVEEDKEEDENFSDYIELEQWSEFFNGDCDIIYELVGKRIVKKPTKKHTNGLKTLVTNQREVLDSMLNALLIKYPKMQEEFDYPINEKKEIMPEITSIEGFSELLSPTTIYIHSKYKDDLPYIGYLFSCTWDSEHGLGILMHNNEVIEIGEGSIAFSLQ